MNKQKREEPEKRREEKKKEDQGRERARRKKMQVREKADKSRNTMFWGSGGSKSRLAKAADAEPSGGMNNCTPLRHDEFKMYKAHHSRSIFGSWDVEKVHGVVARSTFGTQNVQSTLASEHFWKLSCWKSGRCWSAKHIFRSQHVKYTSCSERVWKLRCWKSARRCGMKHISKSKVLKTEGLGCTFPKASKTWVTWGFCAVSKTMAGVGHLKRICKDAFVWQGQYKRHNHQTC